MSTVNRNSSRKQDCSSKPPINCKLKKSRKIKLFSSIYNQTNSKPQPTSPINLSDQRTNQPSRFRPISPADSDQSAQPIPSNQPSRFQPISPADSIQSAQPIPSNQPITSTRRTYFDWMPRLYVTSQIVLFLRKMNTGIGCRVSGSGPKNGLDRDPDSA